MAIEYQLFDSAEAYRPRIPEVAQLFSTVFQRAFPADAWGQWYLSNPYGNPYVALGYHDDQLVGHHALIPQKLVGGSGEFLRYFLSVSTMVHPRHRGLGAFLHMVDALHEEARGAGAACVLAFPNGSSAPLFEKLFRYTPMAQTELCNWRPQPTIAASERIDGPLEMRGLAQYSYPLDNVYWNWRTQNNHARSCTVAGTLHLVYKVTEPATLMLLDAWVEGERNPTECLAHLANDLGLSEIRLTRYHAALLGIPDAELTPHEGYVVRFFGFPLVEEVPDIRFSLLLSDVF
jgi:GNAT superfamily N-acetyltransferase